MLPLTPRLYLLVTLLASAAIVGGSREVAPTQPPPALKSGVSLVTLDFLVLGRDGRPITDLRPDEVGLKVGGKARPLGAVNLIDVTTAGLSPLPPPFGTNVQTREARDFVLVVDDDSFRVGTERAVREAADAFLDGLAPSDRIALVTMPYGGTRVHLTTRQEEVQKSLAGVIGQAAPSETPDEMACRSRRTLESLRGLFDGFAGGGSPVTVAFVSASMVGPNQQVIRSGERIATCALLPDNWNQVGTAASAAGARLYIIEPVGLSNQVAGLEHLAGVTGAVRLHLGGTGENAFTRILRETAAFYRVAFEPEPSQRNGNAHRVELRVTRPDVTVRVRPTIRIDRAEPKAAAPPKDLLRQGRVLRDLPLRVTGFASRASGPQEVKVIAFGETTDGAATLAAAAAGLIDGNGKLVAQALFEANDLNPGQPAMAAMLVPPGLYRLRFAATDASGRAGTADYELLGELPRAGSLQLSGLVLGLSRGGFVARMQFGTEPVAIAYLELYGGQPGQPVSASFELARTQNGPAMVTMPGTLAVAGDHYSITAPIPIGNLSPGDYVVRATVGAVGQPATRVQRTLRKVVE